MIGNKHIDTGYRIGYNTKLKAFLSLFELHNETGNVWSHLLGALLYISFTVYVIIYMSPKEHTLLQICPENNDCTVSNLVMPH